MAKEKRLISLDDAIKATHSEIYWTESQQAGVRSFLVKQPKVDAVEVVRCKDCVYATVGNGDLYCDGPIGIFGTVGFNDYCSCGERREGE